MYTYAHSFTHTHTLTCKHNHDMQGGIQLQRDWRVYTILIKPLEYYQQGYQNGYCVSLWLAILKFFYSFDCFIPVTETLQILHCKDTSKVPSVLCLHLVQYNGNEVVGQRCVDNTSTRANEEVGKTDHWIYYVKTNFGTTWDKNVNYQFLGILQKSPLLFTYLYLYNLVFKVMVGERWNFTYLMNCGLSVAGYDGTGNI